LSSEREALKAAFLAGQGLGAARREKLPGDASTRLYERLHLPGGGRLIFMDLSPSVETRPCPPEASPDERRALGYNAIQPGSCTLLHPALRGGKVAGGG